MTQFRREFFDVRLGTGFSRSKCKRQSILISDVLPFGRLWYGEPNAPSNAVDYVKFYSRSHDAVIRVYSEAGNVIETHEHAVSFCSRLGAESSLDGIRTFLCKYDCRSNHSPRHNHCGNRSPPHQDQL
jgi:hypothetical protein